MLYQANTDFLQSQIDPLTNMGADLIGWEKVPSQYRLNFSSSAISDLNKFPFNWPELKLLPISAATFPVNNKFNYVFITVTDVAPLSQENVTINSTNTDSPPIINPN